MKAASMDPAVERVVRAVLDMEGEPLPWEYARPLLADRDHLADLVGLALVIASLAPGETAATDHAMTAAVDALRLRAEQAEAKVAAATTVIDVLHEAHMQGASRVRSAIGCLCQALLGLPSDTCRRCGSGDGDCELWCDLEERDGGEG